MNKVKAFYNRNFKFLMLLFSINPIVNIILDNKKKEVLQNNYSQFGFILTIIISLVFIYYYNNLERVKRINSEKTSFVVFAMFSLICSIFKYTFIETLIISFQGTLVFFVMMTVFINKIENKINRIKIVESKDICKEEEKLYDSRVPSKDRILKILKEEAKSLILVDGEWGIGKTFFMDRVLYEGKNILAVKVDVLLFNEKKQMINFVMEEINKILLEKGIRSTSIRKYLSVINDGIDNKFINGLYSLFSDDRAENIENDIKEDIEALKDEKLVVIVDNLERTLDKKITIDILGFLHYIYEKLGINVVVLADSIKLRDEIKREKINVDDYLDKFFDNYITLSTIDYIEIIKKINKKETLNNFQFIQTSLKYIDIKKIIPLKEKLKKEEDRIGILGVHGDKKEEKLSETNSTIKKVEDELKNYENDYLELTKKLGIPRTFEKVVMLYETIKNEIETIYGKDLKIDEIILRMAFYKYIFRDKFDFYKLRKYNPVRYQLLYGDYKTSGFEFEIKERTSLDKSIINTLNFHRDDIIKSIEIVESLDTTADINNLLKYFQIYYSTIYQVQEKRKYKLIEFFNKIGPIIENTYEKIDFSQANFEGIIIIDLYNYIAGKSSLIEKLFLHSRISSDNMLTGSLSKIYNDIINEIFEIKYVGHGAYASYGLHEIHKKSLGYLDHENISEMEQKNCFIEKLNEEMKNANLNKLEEAQLNYFISVYNVFISKSKIIWLTAEQAMKKIELLEEEINLNEVKINTIPLTIEGQWEIENIINEIKKFKKEIEIAEVELMRNGNYTINNGNELKNVINFVKMRHETSSFNLFNFEYINKKILSGYYKEFVEEKDFLRDNDFEKILKKANIIIFPEENLKTGATHDL